MDVYKFAHSGCSPGGMPHCFIPLMDRNSCGFTPAINVLVHEHDRLNLGNGTYQKRKEKKNNEVYTCPSRWHIVHFECVIGMGRFQSRNQSGAPAFIFHCLCLLQLKHVEPPHTRAIDRFTNVVKFMDASSLETWYW